MYWLLFILPICNSYLNNWFPVLPIKSTDFSNPKQMVRTSNDYGVTFNSAVNASINASADPCECCKGSLVVDDANIFLLFRKNDNNINVVCPLNTVSLQRPDILVIISDLLIFLLL